MAPLKVLLFRATALTLGLGAAHGAYKNFYPTVYPVTGQLAFITGASSGIGKCTAELLAAKGAKVVLVALPDGTLKGVAEGIRSTGGVAHFYEADCTNADAVAAVCATVEKEHGVPDIIVNSAGMGAWKYIEKTTAQDVVRMMGAPYFAGAFTVLGFINQMLKRNSGIIVNINSPVSYIAWPGCMAYHATRGAFRAFTQALRMDTRGTGVTAVEVLLAAVKSNYYTANQVDMAAQLPKSAMLLIPVLTPEEAAVAVVKAVETRRSVSAPWELTFALWQYRLLPCFTDYLMWKTAAGRPAAATTAGK